MLLALAFQPRGAPPPSEGPVLGGTPRSPGPPVEVTMLAPVPRLAPREERAAPAPGGRPPGARARAGATRPGGSSLVTAPPAPLALAEATATLAELPVPAGSPSPPAEVPVPDEGAPDQGRPGAEGAGRGTRDGTGDGAGDGDGDGAGAENLGKELHARIRGDLIIDLPGDDRHRTVLTHEQATSLRQRDIFPRLPESLWPAWRPYVVTLRVCVDEQGAVSDATLLSSAAPRLDRMVATAARSWRYRPFEASGHATAFCHAVVIQYEHW